MNLVIRNRILSIALTTLLVIALLFLLFFLFLQVKLTKRIQQQQQKQQYTVQLLQHFLDADNRISYVKDDGGRFIFVNAALEAFLSKPSGELLGKNIEEVASSAFALMTNQSDQQVMESMSATIFESTWEQKIFQVTKFPLILPDGKPGIGTFAQDITEAKRQDEALKHNLKRAAMLTELLSSSIAHPQTQMHRALDKACELTQSHLGILLLTDEKTSTLQLAATSGDLNSFCRLEERPQLLNPALSDSYRKLFMDGKPLIENQGIITTDLKAYINGLEDTLKTMITVPFFVDAELAGIVLLANNPSGYGASDCYQVQLLLSGIHTSIQKALKEKELETSQQSLRLILDSTAEGIFGMDRRELYLLQCQCLSCLATSRERCLAKHASLIHHRTKNAKLFLSVLPHQESLKKAWEQ